MAKKRKEDAPPPGAPAWQTTFGDLMNLLLCFFVLLFSMSKINAEDFSKLAASFSNQFSIFDAGSTSIGDGILVSNGVSQLNKLDEYINDTGRNAENDEESDQYDEIENQTEADAAKQMEQAQLNRSEELAEQIQETLNEDNLTDKIDVQFTSQYVQLTLNGAILFDSGKAELKKEVLPILSQVGEILEKYAGQTIEIEGHTDNVPIHNSRYANNNELSSARALSVFDYFVANTNLDPANIKTSGRGEYVPVADNSTTEGRAANRRVEIRIYHELSYYR